MSVLNCEPQIVPWTGPMGADNAPDLTVGRPFAFQCTGEWPALNLEKTELRLEKADHFKLKLLELQKTSPDVGLLKVVSYVPGNHQLKAVQLVDPESSVVLSDLQFSVKSVIDPKDPPKGPFGPMGPIEVGIPPIFWWSLALAILLVALAAGLRAFLLLRQRRWLKEMNLNGRSLSPIAELSKALRDQQRKLHGIEEFRESAFLDSLGLAFRVYLARKFQLPTLRLSDATLTRKISKRVRPLDPQLPVELRQIFEEIRRAKEAGAKHVSESSGVGSAPVAGTRIRAQDYDQVIKMVRRFGERLEQAEGRP